jgi:phosphoribosylformimino-5-aminoimidazole carboxamide ribotide isomerase
MILVPSISIKDGKVIRLSKGDYSSGKIYDRSPIDLARQFEDHGITRIHLIDLDGAKKGTPVNYHILETLVGYTKMAINFSGGIHTDGDVIKAFEYGAESIASATIAVYNPDLFSSWLMSYGREKIALGADTLDGLIRVGGWQKETKIDLFDHVDHFYSKGLKYLKTTDISKEGLMEGPSFDLYKDLIERFPDLCLFASGGIRDINDMIQLQEIGVYGVIFGKAFYEGRISLSDLEQFAVGV